MPTSSSTLHVQGSKLPGDGHPTFNMESLEWVWEQNDRCDEKKIKRCCFWILNDEKIMILAMASLFISLSRFKQESGVITYNYSKYTLQN